MSQPQTARFFYRVFGLTIGSTFEIPELIRLPPHEPEVVIHEGPVPKALVEPLKIGRRLQIRPAHFLYHQEGVAGYHVTAGKRIVVQPSESANAREVRLYLLGAVLGALVHQRGGLPFHASAIEVNGRAVLFSGPTLAGKSTTAAAFARRGHRMLTDDICVCRLKERDEILAYPGIPGFKLWEDAISRSGEDVSRYPRIRDEVRKYAVPAADRFGTDPLPLGVIYVLSAEERADIVIEPREGLDRFNELRHQVYKKRFVKFMGRQKSYLATLGRLSAQVPVLRVRRPRQEVQLDQLVDALEQDFARHGG